MLIYSSKTVVVFISSMFKLFKILKHDFTRWQSAKRRCRSSAKFYPNWQIKKSSSDLSVRSLLYRFRKKEFLTVIIKKFKD